MIGNNRVKQRKQNLDSLTDAECFQRFQKIIDTECQKTHLKECIERDGGNHIGGQKEADMIKQFENHRMHKWMMVTVCRKIQNLFELVDAVRRHDARIFIQKIGEPAEQAAEKAEKRKMLYRASFLAV